MGTSPTACGDTGLCGPCCAEKSTRHQNYSGQFMNSVGVTEDPDVASILCGRSQESRPEVVIVEWPSAWRS